MKRDFAFPFGQCGTGLPFTCIWNGASSRATIDARSAPGSAAGTCGRSMGARGAPISKSKTRIGASGACGGHDSVIARRSAVWAAAAPGAMLQRD